MVNQFLSELASVGIEPPFIPPNVAPFLRQHAPFEYSSLQDPNPKPGRWGVFYHLISDSVGDSITLFVAKAGDHYNYHYHLIYGPLWIFLDTPNLPLFNHCLNQISHMAQSLDLHKKYKAPLAVILSTAENSHAFYYTGGRPPYPLYYQSPQEVLASIPELLYTPPKAKPPLSEMPFWVQQPLKPSDFIFLQNKQSIAAADFISKISEPKDLSLLSQVIMRTLLENQIQNPIPLGHSWGVVALYPKNFRITLGRHLWLELHDNWYSARDIFKQGLFQRPSLALAVLAFFGQPQSMRITTPLSYCKAPVGLAWSPKKPKTRSVHSLYPALPVAESFADYFKDKTRPHLFIK